MYHFSQAQIFMIFFIVGVLTGILFDLFRAKRKVFRTSDIVTNCEDVVFLLISGFLIISCILKLNNGEIRTYIFLAILFGIIIYFLTISNICVIIFYTVVKLCKMLFVIPIQKMKTIRRN